MAELRPFATAKQAADIGGITPTDIGISATAFVRKSELVKTGKFDETSLASYQGAWFVNLDAVKKASGGSAYIEWLPFGKILANARGATTFVSCRGDYVGDPTVKVSGELKNVTARIVASSVSDEWTHRIDLTFDQNLTLKDLTSIVTVTIIDADGKSVSSSEEIVQNASKFEYEPTTLTFGGEDITTQQIVTVVSPGAFSVSTDSPSWIGFSKQENATVKVYMLAKNTSDLDRTGKLVLTYNYTGDRFEVSVVQRAKEATGKISISPTSVDFAWDSTQGENIEVSTGGSGFIFGVTYGGSSDKDWLTVEADGISENVTVVPASKNTSGSVRTATVIFILKTDATQKAYLRVSQQLEQSPIFEVSPAELFFNHNGGGSVIMINSSNAWTATVDDEPDTQFTVTPTSLTFNADEIGQERVAIVTVVCPGEFTISKDSSLTWLGYAKQQDSTVEVYCNSVNDGTQQRVGKITFSYNGKNIDVTVVQKGSTVTPDPSDTLEVSPTSLSFTDDPTSGQTIQVTTTGNLTIE